MNNKIEEKRNDIKILKDKISERDQKIGEIKECIRICNLIENVDFLNILFKDRLIKLIIKE